MGIDFAKCPKRGATCYAPSRCADLCKVIPVEWVNAAPPGFDIGFPPDAEAVHNMVEDIEDDGDVTLYPRMGAME